ncbi:chromatin modification-related protein EAF7-domain-containing protein [Rhexocercosporidium sp. MPI-PUGE-AT-0058]|nr:chromatin modification-related protein EAF7-domain-containing protein [Rhexocercosporidium sp. MPI-PUGE-AT-0058]
MPPRKKTKGSVRAPSTPAADEDAMAVDTPQPDATEEKAKPTYDILKDPWTDEQETSLFKGIIRWKPAGIHKHFRMIAISEHLRNHGYDPTIEQHTRIPGIWQKLRTIYDLDVIDDRENYIDDYDQFLEFKLPEEDFDEMMFMKGQKRPGADNTSEAPSSPPQLGRLPSPSGARKRKRGDTITAKNRADTVDDTDEARTPPANSPPKSTRAGRSTNRSIGRLKGDSTSRQQSKDTSATADTADEDDGGEETEEVAEEDEDAEEEGTASPKPSKASKAKADPPTRKSRRKK